MVWLYQTRRTPVAAHSPTIPMASSSGFPRDPSGASFVTPALGATSPRTGFGLPAIWRVAQNAAGGFEFSAQLSTPTYNSFSGAGTTQIYPAISPSGASLAYFDIFFPDLLFSFRPATARLIVASANGSNARIVHTFDSGFYPAGLAWSRDGTQLVFSVARQIQLSGGYTTLVDPSTAVISQIPAAGGTPTAVPGISNGLFPSVSAVALLPSITNDITPPKLRIRGARRSRPVVSESSSAEQPATPSASRRSTSKSGAHASRIPSFSAATASKLSSGLERIGGA